VFLLIKKIDHKVLIDLGLDREPAVAALEAGCGYDSLQLVDRILEENRTSQELGELRDKAQKESEDDTWQLRNGLLLRSGKLIVTEGGIESSAGITPLWTAIVREAHEQPLLGHSERAKLKQLISL
jgi:hypothetical protein